MRNVLIRLGVLVYACLGGVGAGWLLTPHASAAVDCAPVTVRHLTTITITDLCPSHVRVELARPEVVTGFVGEVPQVEYNVPVAYVRARHGVASFGGIHLGWQYEWRTIRGDHHSAWTVVNV